MTKEFQIKTDILSKLTQFARFKIKTMFLIQQLKNACNKDNIAQSVG